MKSACPTADVAFYYRKLKRTYDECPTWRDEALESILALSPSAVVMVNASSGYASGQESSVGLSHQEWKAGVKRTLSRFTNSALPVVLIRDNPRPAIKPAVCLSRAAFQGRRIDSACPYDRSEVLNEAIFAVELRAMKSRPNSYIIDFTDWFCTDAKCLSYRNEIIIYRDGNHLSRSAVLALAPALEEQLVGIVTQDPAGSSR